MAYITSIKNSLVVFQTALPANHGVVTHLRNNSLTSDSQLLLTNDSLDFTSKAKSFKVKVNDLSFSVHVADEISGESLYFSGEDRRPDRGRKDFDHSILLCITEETISTKPSFLEKQNKVDYSDDRRFGNPIGGDRAREERNTPTPSTALKSQDEGTVVRVGGVVSTTENHRGMGFNTVDIDDAMLNMGPGPTQHEEEEVEAQSSSGPAGE
ncbi:hypothetical protein Ancab_038856, partial [Ancistrocladus abbreviatus]